MAQAPFLQKQIIVLNASADLIEIKKTTVKYLCHFRVSFKMSNSSSLPMDTSRSAQTRIACFSSLPPPPHCPSSVTRVNISPLLSCRACPTCSNFLGLVQGIMGLRELLAKMTRQFKTIIKLTGCHSWCISLPV
ncbi:hypothetical protein GJAV_G00066410 [Gymnothorax javanicus]|nr:hypothetical protein GJAV_G00066410 [Gymnothorax javanicus]